MRNKTPNAVLRANHKCRVKSKVMKTFDFHKEKDADIIERLNKAKEEEGMVDYLRRVIREEMDNKSQDKST